MWAVVVYVGCLIVCGLLYGMWAVVWYVGSCILCGLLDIRAAVCMCCCMICELL